MVKLFALPQSRQPIGDRRICGRSGNRRHCHGDVRIFFGGLGATQRLGLHVEDSGAIAGLLHRACHRVEGGVDAAATAITTTTATAEAGERACGFGTRGPLFFQRAWAISFLARLSLAFAPVNAVAFAW